MMKKYNIIAIEREYASGGREIGKRVGEALGIPVYGHEILQMAAERCNTTSDYISHIEEKTTNSLLFSLVMMSRLSSGENGLSSTDKLYLVESEVIKELANEGSCVMVGRCAGYILSERKDCLRVFVYSDFEHRRKRAVEVYGEPEKTVDAVLKKYDKHRSDYYTAYSGKDWKNANNYHVFLDSGKLGVQKCADIIAFAAASRE